MLEVTELINGVICDAMSAVSAVSELMIDVMFAGFAAAIEPR